MALAFRNLDVSAEDPVEDWGVEGVLTAVERGNVDHWRKIARAVAEDPRGKVGRDLAEVVMLVEHEGMAALFKAVLEEAREQRTYQERQQVAQQLSEDLRASGLSRAEFAEQLGTSTSRLSTYLRGKVVPSAVVMVRAADAARRAQRRR